MGTLVNLITAAGYLGIVAAVFSESGLLIGIFLPGDSLLFSAGVLASQGYLNIGLLCILVAGAAVLGDNVGYWIGKRFGRSVFSRKGSFFLDPSHVTTAEQYYARYGSKTIVLARFVPVIRTIAPVLAGVGSMRRSVFFFWNVLGGCLWGIGIPVAGYTLGKTIPDVDRYLLPIIALIVFLSILPGIWHILRDRAYRQQLWRIIRK